MKAWLAQDCFIGLEEASSRQGLPVIVVPFLGCNLNCKSEKYPDYYCSEKYSSANKEVTVPDLINEIKLFPCDRVSIIGGEPLLDHRRAFLETLFTELRSLGYEVSIKTNGSQDIGWVKKEFPEVIVIGGWKCPAISGERANKAMLESNLSLYEKTDALRFMVSRDDLKEVERVLKSHPEIKAQVFLTPVYGTIDPSEISDWIIKHLEFNVRLSSQF